MRISRNTIKYMLKYNGFHVWFGTIFRDSVTYVIIIATSQFPHYDRHYK